MTGQTSLFPPEPAPDPLLCWLWLSQVLGPASLHAGKVLDAFGGAQEAWEARETEEFRQAAGDTAFKRAAQLDAESFHTLVLQCAALRVRILPLDDPDYPLAFSRIPEMPLVLYCTGAPRRLNAPGAVGIVGSLGMSFLCGVFVSMDILGKSVQKIAQFLPVYWYEVANNLLKSHNTFSGTQIHTLYTCYGIQLLFALAFLSLALIAGRMRRQTA